MDQKKLIGNMDLVAAVATFLHLCFVFDLDYPKVVEQKTFTFLKTIKFEIK